MVGTTVIEILHVREGVEIFVAGKERIAACDIMKDSFREPAFVPMHTSDSIGGKVAMNRRCSALVEPNQENFHAMGTVRNK